MKGLEGDISIPEGSLLYTIYNKQGSWSLFVESVSKCLFFISTSK